jgi:hypothetical protein
MNLSDTLKIGRDKVKIGGNALSASFKTFGQNSEHFEPPLRLLALLTYFSQVAS